MTIDTYSLEERDWNRLLKRIKAGKCTPFLGAGACYGSLPLGATIAQTWAAEHDYPFSDTHDLTRVAQYLALTNDAMFPKDELLERWFKHATYPNFAEPDEPHGVLAQMPLPIYITTNYDDFMTKALQTVGKNPRREICRWNWDVQKKLRDQPSVFQDRLFTPDEQNPVVFHLHGYNLMPESIVLTEDDYIDFLISISSDRTGDLLPLRIQESFSDTSLLFIGYSLNDINFRVLFRSIINKVVRTSSYQGFTVQFPRPDKESAQRYLEDYFKEWEMKVVWGSAREFMAELSRRWKAFSSGTT